MINREELMTVGQLIEYLQQQDPDQIVGFAHAAGDYWQTTLVDSPWKVEEEMVRFSSYHKGHKLVENDDDSYEEDEDKPEAWVVLSN